MEKTGAIILAGGKGERFESDIPKQFRSICGKPVIFYSLNVFSSSIPTENTIIVCYKDYIPLLNKLLKSLPCKKLPDIVEGGSNRTESCMHGLRAAREHNISNVLIHDASRPCITAKDVETLINESSGYDGGILGIPATDTIKIVSNLKIVDKTLDRSVVYHALTPQWFPLSIILSAYERGLKCGFSGTDDASFVEKEGGRIRVVSGNPLNIKITFPVDLKIAETIIKSRVCS